eukprot:CAMPEP_0179416750 /NCGR_PEP_ID=MMETSP0799-20121207/6970_1 /TAXON_ID=46947 /ORGANISM="Geminigera cryophila, Strain CCMP2564" /LENGTH=75 /DNA_ID=CAMNT_0021189653 /DNA_START=445 /DNA_END=672 /DNA_ORIENTATION=-
MIKLPVRVARFPFFNLLLPIAGDGAGADLVKGAVFCLVLADEIVEVEPLAEPDFHCHALARVQPVDHKIVVIFGV